MVTSFLNFQIIDSNKEKKRMGYVTVPLKTILAAPNMTIHRPFQVREAAAMSKLTLRLCLRVSVDSWCIMLTRCALADA